MIQNEFIFYSVYDTERLHRLKPVYIRHRKVYTIKKKERLFVIQKERLRYIYL